MDGLGWAGGRKTSQRKIIHHRGMDAKRRALSLYLCFGLHDMRGFLSLYLFPLSTMSSVFFFCMAAAAWRGSGRVPSEGGACVLLFIIVIRHRRGDEGWVASMIEY